MFRCCSGRGSTSETAEESGSNRLEFDARKVNDSLYELSKPAGTPKMEVLFFHGLQFGDLSDAHLRTWESEDGSSLWPKTWLAEEFPAARILCVSYDGGVRKSSESSFDMHIIVENLISDLMQGNIGQTPNCPVVLIGHCVGGLVIEQLCVEANNRKHVGLESDQAKLGAFLENIKGVFFYGTPHHGTPGLSKATKMVKKSPLLSYFNTLSKDGSRLDFEFNLLRQIYTTWRVWGVGGNVAADRGILQGVVAAPEESARKGDHFNLLAVDHMSICKPKDTRDKRFYFLTELLHNIVKNSQVTMASHEVHGLPKYPIDLERRALDVMDRLIGGAILGICGMGGIGKTTLAKQAFKMISKDFEYTCFVDNVKGIPPHELQDWVLNHFHHNGKKSVHGSTQWSHLQNKKALIALDDVDAKVQLKFLPNLEHFGAGSCVILTSRNREVFKHYKGCVIHEVEFLKDDDAKNLLCHDAFESNDVPEFLIDKVNAVVQKCNGLPLTLEVIGQYLRGREANVEVWIETLHRLKEARALAGGTDDEVWPSLRISYDALSPEEQEMFTEAALIFFEQPLEEALAAWSSLTETMQITWENLVSRSLVKEINNKVWVHEHLRDLAQNISKNIMILGTDHDTSDSAVDRLNDKEVEAGTKCLRLRYNYPINKSQRTLQLDSLAKLKGLKYMDLGRVSAASSANGLTRKISFLRFSGPDGLRSSKFEFSLHKMENLAVLDLSHFRIPEEFPEALGNLTNLRILRLNCLEGSVHLPENFGNLSRLRRLELTELRSLTLPESFGNLRALEHLKLARIESSALPESLGNLSRLATLRIYSCKELAGLPDSFGSSLTSLEQVRIYRCRSIKCLPPSFSRLPGLQRLTIDYCDSFEELGDAFGNLSSLRELSLRRVALETLPPSFSLLAGLELLRIETAGQLRSLPDDFAQWTALKDLFISSKELETLPAGFCCLQSLRQLKIDCPKLEMLPGSLGELALLEGLELVVDRVEILPLSVCNLSLLRDFAFTSSVAKLLPESLGQLSSLKTFRLNCPLLEKLPHTLGKLSSLEVLSIGSSSLETLPEILWELSSLGELSLSVRLLDSLPESLGGLNNLRKLSLREAKRLKRLPEYFGQLIKLQELEIDNAGELQTLPDSFSRLKSLRGLTLDCSKLEMLPDNFGDLSSLERLSISSRSLKSLPESILQLQTLKRLTLACADNLKTLPEDFGHLIALQYLEISDADELQTLPDTFSCLKSLQTLKLRCPKLERLPDNFGNLASLEELSIRSTSLKSLPESIRQLQTLKKFTLKAGKSDRSLLDGIGKISSLDYFEFDCHGHEETPDLFEQFTCFAHQLTLSGQDTRILPAGLGSLSSLKALTLRYMPLLETLPDELGTLASLESLTIFGCGSLESLPDSLGQLSSLKEVTLSVCWRLKTLPEGLGGSSLTEVALPQGDQSDDLRLQAEESSQTKKTEAMRVRVYRCPLLDDAKMDSLGWMHNYGETSYRRKAPMGTV